MRIRYVPSDEQSPNGTRCEIDSFISKKLKSDQLVIVISQLFEAYLRVSNNPTLVEKSGSIILVGDVLRGIRQKIGRSIESI
jgi:hypothetical protein